ncbi:MAG TPA: DUF1015 domain-containing protein [Thermoanaerobaculia bacterium]|nr:DUF1015 domain-containing protein [Thermoanaerobaculia bacterium]
MRIYAFRGTRYDGGGDDPAARGRLAAPPYDQISDERAPAFHALDRHHFAWLIKPLPGQQGASGDRYREAARLHAAWLADGAIVRDPRPALYPNAIDLPDGSRRLGLTALVGLEPPESGVIRPHEETLAKPFADRLALLRATEADLEPVLLLSEDGGELDRLLEEDVAGARQLASHEDAFGNRHHLYRIDAPDRVLRYRTVLHEAPSAIADGHHRYKVALRYAGERGLAIGAGGDAPPPAAATKLAVVTSVASPAVDIQPIHRAFAEDPGIARAAGLAASREPLAAADGRALAAAVARADRPDRPALGVHRRGEPPELWRLDPAAPGAEELAPGARRLAVALLHACLFPAMGLPAEAVTDGTTLYRPDPTELWRMVAEGGAAVGLYLPAMAPEQFAAAIAEGDMLPPKSTRFLPKVVSGLVWAEHRAGLA